MAKRSPKSRKLGLYTNLKHKRATKKDAEAKKRAEYLASLPKNPFKRFLYRLNPRNAAKYWFSKRGLFMALRIIGVLILLSVLAVGAVFAYYRKDVAEIDPEKLAAQVQTTVSKYYDRNGVLLWEDKGQGDYRLVVQSDEISDYMKKATVAIEDKSFYEHDGVSFAGLLRAGLNNAGGDSVQGGSTLTQQLVKQVFFTQEEQQKRGLNGVPRKIKEVILAMEVERKYTKDQILTLYMNQSSYGGRRNGVESAAQTYFGKSAKKLTLAEAAMLAAIPNQPGLYNPYNNAGHDALVARQQKVLDDMVKVGYISQDEATQAKAVDILAEVKPVSDQLANIKAPHFVLMVRDELEAELGKAVVGRGGLEIKTTLDWRIQQKLEESFKNMFASSIPTTAGFKNGAATIEDVKTGQIVGLLGSRDFSYPGFGQDNAATAYLQPGSTIKPLVYASLFRDHGGSEQNYGSGSVLSDDKSMDAIYGAPLQNADGKYKGNITIRNALATSRNIPAVKAMYVNGTDKTMADIHALGDKSYCTQGSETQSGLASAIGGCGAIQVEHVNAIASLARLGTYKPYSTVLEVKNNNGDVLKKYTEESKQVLDPQAAYIVADILHDDAPRAGFHGTNQYGFVMDGVPTATKTGTSDLDRNAKDIWTISYSPVLAMAVWFGNSDNTVLAHASSKMAARPIGDVMPYAHKTVYAQEGKWKLNDWFTAPTGIQKINGEIYPSYYNKKQESLTKKVIFDKVSKKVATECTPDSTKIEIEVYGRKDPVTKKVVYSKTTEGYDPNSKDDVHKCDGAQPSVSSSVSSDGKSITVSYKAGSFSLKQLTVKVNGATVANKSVSKSGTEKINYNPAQGKGYTVTVELTDEGGYSASSSATYSP